MCVCVFLCMFVFNNIKSQVLLRTDGLFLHVAKPGNLNKLFAGQKLFTGGGLPALA